MSNPIRIGGPVFADLRDPQALVTHLQACGYAAAYHPHFEVDGMMQEAVQALAEADIVIAETGAFGINLIEPDPQQRQRNLDEVCRRLERAESVGSLCCVAHGGWLGSRRNQFHRDNFSQQSVDTAIESVRKIIDAVAPQRTKFVLETESRYLPDSPDVYLQILEAV